METEAKKEDVTIRGTANVDGGTTCAPCVAKRHSECNASSCLCAKHSHVVN